MDVIESQSQLKITLIVRLKKMVAHCTRLTQFTIVFVGYGLVGRVGHMQPYPI